MRMQVKLTLDLALTMDRCAAVSCSFMPVLQVVERVPEIGNHIYGLNGINVLDFKVWWTRVGGHVLNFSPSAEVVNDVENGAKLRICIKKSM